MKKKDLKDRGEEIESLVVLIKKGDHDAFSKLYDIFIDPLYRYVYYRVNADDAEDILETVFLKVWENIKKYKKGTNFSAWIFRIAHNLVVDYYRSSKDREFQELNIQIPDDKREHNPIKTTERSFNQEILKKGLSKLKKRYQEIIIYKFINGFSNKEIAKMMKKSEGSLRILQYRALKALKREFEDMGIDYHI